MICVRKLKETTVEYHLHFILLFFTMTMMVDRAGHTFSKNVTPLLTSVLASLLTCCFVLDKAQKNRIVSVTMCVKYNTVLEVSHCVFKLTIHTQEFF